MEKTSHMFKTLCAVVLAGFLLAVSCPPAQSHAANDQGTASSYAIATADIDSSIDSGDSSENEEFFVIGGNLVSAVKTTSEVTSTLQAEGDEVNSIEHVVANVFVVNVDGDGDAIDTASDIVEDEKLDAHIAPVKKHKVYHPENYSKTTYKDYCQIYQAETFGNAFTEEDGYDATDSFNGSSTWKTYQMAEESGNSATIAVVDSGVRTTHKLLKGMVLENLAYNAHTGQIGKNAVSDKVDHGTGVSSIIVSNPYYQIEPYGNYYRTGVCANTKILPIKVTGDDGDISDVDIIKAISYSELPPLARSQAHSLKRGLPSNRTGGSARNHVATS